MKIPLYTRVFEPRMLIITGNGVTKRFKSGRDIFSNRGGIDSIFLSQAFRSRKRNTLCPYAIQSVDTISANRARRPVSYSRGARARSNGKKKKVMTVPFAFFPSFCLNFYNGFSTEFVSHSFYSRAPYSVNPRAQSCFENARVIRWVTYTFIMQMTRAVCRFLTRNHFLCIRVCVWES